MSNYIELHAASAFSFLDGASTPEALVDRAADLGYSTLALLDRDGVYGAPRFHQAARAAGLKAIVGAELTMAPFNPQSNRPSAIGNRQCAGLWLLPVLVESREGYRNLCRLVTRMKLRAPTSLRQGYGGPPELQRRRKGEGALTLEDLEGRTAGLVALAGRAALAGRRYGVGGLVDRLVGLFGRAGVFVEIAAAPAARRGGGHPGAPRSGVGLSRAGRRDQRRPLRGARRAAALRRPHLHPPQDDAGAGRPAAERERRAVPEAARGHGAAVRRPAARGGGDARAGRTPRVHAGRPRLPLSRLPRARRARRRRRSCGRSPRWARASATGRTTSGRAGRSRASWISSRSSTSPATSSSSGTSSISAGSRAFSCRGAGRRPTAPCATASASPPWIRWAWTCSSSGSSRRSGASGPTSTSTCRAATAASRSSSTCTRSTAGTAPR